MIRGRQPITEAGFLQEPLGKQYFDYARYTVASFVRDVELKWHPGRAGISLDAFVMDTSIYAIELAKEDYAKGLFRNEDADSFRKFFFWRIKKAFFAKLDELGKDPRQAVFDERLGKYYEGTAVDFGPTDENDDPVAIPDDPAQEEEETTFKRSKEPVTHRTPKKPNEDVILYFYSEEKAAVLEESYLAKMRYVRRILDIVSLMSPGDQRLFYLKYQFGFSEEDFQLWESIGQQEHVKDPFTRMAKEKFGLSENYAKKRISQIKADIIAKLNQSGHTQASYRQDTSVPTMLQSLFNSRPRPELDIDTGSLSEAECRDILVELHFGE